MIHANIVQNPTSRAFPNFWRAVYAVNLLFIFLKSVLPDLTIFVDVI